MPFTTIVVGRFPHEAPAIWLYAGNTALIAAASSRTISLLPEGVWSKDVQARRLSLAALLLSSLLAIAISFVSAPVALWALALNIVAPLGLPPRTASEP